MFHLFNRKKGRYTETKPNKERKVISYEDVPLDDYEQERTDINPKTVKKIIIAVAIVLAAGLAVLAFANRDKLTPENLGLWWSYEVLGNGGHGYPAEIIGSEVKPGNFSVNQSRVAYASDTSFVTLNSSGKEILLKVQMPDLASVHKNAVSTVLAAAQNNTTLKDQILNGSSTVDPNLIVPAYMLNEIKTNGVSTVEKEIKLSVVKINGDFKIKNDDQLKLLLSDGLSEINVFSAIEASEE